MDCNKGFCSNYMLLKPEEVTFFDLFHILFSRNIEQRKFVEAPQGTEENFWRRWIIFLSVLMQKFLQFVSKPLSIFGCAFETFLNLLSSNGNLFMLILKIIRGKLVIPDKTSATFLSFIGNTDKRLKLDDKITREDRRYNSALSMMASKVSYENKAFIQEAVQHHWNMEYLGFYDFWNEYQEKATTQAFIMRDKNEDHDTIFVVFRGTEPFDADAWCTDFNISWYELPGIGKIHAGFMEALGLQKNIGWPQNITKRDKDRQVAYYYIRETLKELLKQNNNAKFIVTGHSLGGALAILFPAVLTMHEEKWLLERMEGVYTFGQPRVGDETFGKFMEYQMKLNDVRYFRFVYGYDMVPRVPADDGTLRFKHFGTCVYFNRRYETKIVAEEPDKNYFSVIMVIPMLINSFCELLRSFSISFTKGQEYKEGGVEIMVRLIGLIIPGVSAHFPQDYVNSTRLGSTDLLLFPS